MFFFLKILLIRLMHYKNFVGSPPKANFEKLVSRFNLCVPPERTLQSEDIFKIIYQLLSIEIITFDMK